MNKFQVLLRNLPNVSGQKTQQSILQATRKKVVKLQRKIAVAYKRGDMRRVRELQRILVNSIHARVLAVHRVLSRKGGNTPGVDNYVPETAEQVQDMVTKLGKITPNNYQPMPVLRVWIPKGYGSDEKRPLGIPTIFDRAVQCLYMMALLPIAELTADEGSFGYRQGLGTLDAVDYTKNMRLKLPRPMLVLDADIKGFFDNVSHKWLLENIPMNKIMLLKFLTAGALVDGKFVPTTSGFPQGAVISPVLANMCLDGMHEKIKRSLRKYDKLVNILRFVRYADDFVVMGPNKKWVFDRYIIPVIVKFLSERGLVLNMTKTKLVEREEGFDFLGYNMQWVVNQNKAGKYWLRATPSNKAKNAFKRRVKDILGNAFGEGGRREAIDKLNYLIQGWARYHRYGNATTVFRSLDHYVWHTYFRWLKKRFNWNSIVAEEKGFIKKGGKASYPYYVNDEGNAIVLKRLGDTKMAQYERANVNAELFKELLPYTGNYSYKAPKS